MASQDGPHVSNNAGDGAGGGGQRGGEEGTASLTLASFEVAVAGGDAVFAGLELIAVHGDAHGAARLAPVATGGAEDPVEAFGFGLALDFHGAGDDHDADARVDFAALENGGGGAEIGDAGIGAASDEDHIDGVAEDRLAAFETHIGEGFRNGFAL